jgi:hypothetical protein
MKITDINNAIRDAKKAFIDPDYPGYVRIEYRRHHEWMTIKEFITLNPKLGDVVKGAKETPPDLTSIVTKTDKNTLVDDEQRFKINEYMGFHVWISRGHGEGQVRSVIKNDINTITLDKPWDTKPDSTSQYVLASEINEDMKVMGNTLPQEDMKKLEEQARQMDIKNGIKPAKRQYTTD